MAQRTADGNVDRTRAMRHRVIISAQAADTPARQHDGKFVATNASLACSYCTFQFTYRDSHNRGLGYSEPAKQDLLYPRDETQYLFADNPCHLLTDRWIFQLTTSVAHRCRAYTSSALGVLRISMKQGTQLPAI